MHYRPETSGVAIHLIRTGRMHPLLYRAPACVLVAAIALFIGRANAQDTLPPAMESASADAGAPPMSESGGGDLNYFSQDLGTILRLQYRTESYGQDGVGNFDIGTFQIVTMGDTAAFFDGQVTMNESDGVGFNVGLGYRWMNYPVYAAGSGRMDGISLWADGTHTDAGNFFPQVGVSYESLGEVWDVRANGYIPVGENEQVGRFKATNLIDFSGNALGTVTRATADRSFYSAELEIARRLGAQRDAWGFAGPYFVANDVEDSAGFRAGFRGYAYPDLLLQIAVSDDEVFHTNAAFSATWFVGRTRTNFQPACGTPDRFREPVMRNDYVVLSHKTRLGNDAFTNTDGTELRFVHVDSNVATTGDGTAERPFKALTDVNGTGSNAGDIILAHSTSVFNGESTVTLKDNQRLLGEGNNLEFNVTTLQKGQIVIPETSPGARALAQPVVNASTADAIALANANEVANFDLTDINGKAISGTGLTGNANLHDLKVTGGTNFAISLVDIDTTSAVTINQITYDGGTTSLGGVHLENFDGSLSATSSTLTGGTGASKGLEIVGDSDGAINFASTVTFDEIGGTAVDINGDVGGDNQIGSAITVAGNITDPAVTSVSVQGLATGGSANFAGNIIGGSTVAQTGDGIFVNSNATGSNIVFTGQLSINTTANGFVATSGINGTDGGTITASATNNTINTTTGQVVKITDMTIGSNDVKFSDVNNTVAAAAETTSAIELQRNTGAGSIDIGNTTDLVGEAGTIEGGDADTIVINNSANVAITGLIINNNVAGHTGVAVTKTNTGTQTTALNDLAVNDGDTGIKVIGGGAGAGALNMTISDTAITGSELVGLDINNVDTGTIQVNSATIDGENAGATATGVRITGSNASITFDQAPATDNTLIKQWSGLDFEVDGGSPNVTFNGTIDNTDTDGRSVNVHNIAGGTVLFTPDSSITDENDGLRVNGNTGGTISFNGTNDFDTANGVDAVTVDNNSGATSVIFDNLDITTKTTGRGVVFQNNSDTASVTFDSLDITTISGRGLDVENNSDTASATFTNLAITTGAGDGVFIAGNTATNSFTFTGVDVTTQSGTAFSAVGGGDLTVNGDNNVLKVTAGAGTGAGLVITGMNIDGQAVFESVTTTNTANGVALTNVTGGQVTVGETGSAAHSGGTFTTTGDAIALENVSNVDLLHMQVINSGGQGVNVHQGATATTAMDVTIDDLDLDAATFNGIQVLAEDDNTFAMRLTNSDLEENVVMTSTGSGHFGLLVDNTDINTNVSAPAVDAFALDITGAASSDITLRNGNNFTAGNANALSINADNTGAATSKLLINGSSMFTNSSATSAAADIRSQGVTQMDATIQSNTFANTLAAPGFDMRVGDATAGVLLNLGSTTAALKNTGISTSADKFLLHNTTLAPTAFRIFQKDATVVTDTKNVGAVNTDPDNNAFTDSGTDQPVLPTVP